MCVLGADWFLVHLLSLDYNMIINKFDDLMHV